MSNEALLQAALTLGLLEELGFEPAKKSSLPSMLSRITPSGGTAMRDSLIQGIDMMLQLYDVLTKLGTAHNWNFVHVLITDGDDCNSKSTLEEAAILLGILGHKIPTSLLKTWFIGVDIQGYSKAAQEMAALVSISQGHASFQVVSDGNLERIFEKVRISIGLIRETNVVGVVNDEEAIFGIDQKHHLLVAAEEAQYCVLFNLDMSGSMSGSKWNKVCKCVNNFIQHLGPRSLVGGLAFNDSVHLLNKAGLANIRSNNTSSYSPPSTYTSSNRTYNNYSSGNSTNYNNTYRSNTNVQQSNNGCVCILIFVVIILIIIIASH